MEMCSITATETPNSFCALLKKYSVITAVAVLVSARKGVLCTPLCLTGDFDSQLQLLLHEQMTSVEDPADILSRVLNDVQTTLNQRWQGYKAIPFGSLANGLFLPTSDIDLYIQLPFYYPRNSGIVQESYKLFKKQPELYTHMTYFDQVNYSLLQFIHIPSQRKVDLMFNFGDMAVEESKLIKYYFNLDERFSSLGKFLKFWFQIQSQNGHRRPITYVLYLLIIFYLQQKNMAPPVYMLQKDSKSHFFHDWDMGFNELPYNSTNTENLYQLLGGFFKYYSEFNYEEYAVAPFAGRPIRKCAFKDIENFPEEYSLYNSNLKNKLQRLIINNFDVSIAACIQDPFFHSFVHSLNDINGLERYNETITFKYFMKSVAKMFEDLPSESILRAILVMDQPKKKVISHHKQSSVGGRHEQDCIDI